MSLYWKERPEFLQQSLNSIFSQTLRADEIVLMKDGPVTPELESIVKEYEDKYSELKVVSIPVNGGLGKALNEGLKLCSHDLVARMDTDDVAEPTRFAMQLDFMQNNPDIDVCSTWLQEFEGDISNKKSIKTVPSSHIDIKKYIKSRNPINHPAVIFRKKAVLDAGGYMPFPLFEDYYLWARMLVNGCKFANIPECLVNFRVSSDMYKRRGGMKYAKDCTSFQWTLHKLGLISSFEAIKASVVRSIVYLLPNKIRSWIYSKFLRS